MQTIRPKSGAQQVAVDCSKWDLCLLDHNWIPSYYYYDETSGCILCMHALYYYYVDK